jgi:NADP-dependent aldehyde dehydrogenase
MSFDPNGKNLIAGHRVAGDGTFRSSPAIGAAHEHSFGTPALVDRTCEKAAVAVNAYRATSQAAFKGRLP